MKKIIITAAIIAAVAIFGVHTPEIQANGLGSKLTQKIVEMRSK